MSISVISMGSKCQNYAPARGPQNQPKAGPEAKVRESASHHLKKIVCKNVFLKASDAFLLQIFVAGGI